MSRRKHCSSPRRSSRLSCVLLSLAVFAACGDDDTVGSPDAGETPQDGGTGGTGAGGDDTQQPGAGKGGNTPPPPVDAGPHKDGGTTPPPKDSGTDAATDPGNDAGMGEPQEDLDSLVFAPSFDADYNTLEPQPWVKVASTNQTNTVTVLPDKLVFPFDGNEDVMNWQAGRVVVSVPGDGSGQNPLGFARRVVAVAKIGNTVEVTTETVAIEDIVTGELQNTIDFDKMTDVDMDKVDDAYKTWAAENLYIDVDTLSPEVEDKQPDNASLPDVDEEDNVVQGDPLWGSIGRAFKRGISSVGKALGKAASSVASGLGAAWRFLTPASFTGSASVSANISAGYKTDMFKVDYTKHLAKTGKTPVDLSITGSGSVDATVSFKPAAQVGMKIPVPGHGEHFASWLNVDSQFRSRFALKLELEAEIASVNNMKLMDKEAQMKLMENVELATDVLTQARESFLGDEDMKPAGGWKRTIYISKPSWKTVFAGPVPVVISQTFQLDLECGFSAKASIKADLLYERVSNVKFGLRYEQGKVTGGSPKFENRKNRSVTVTGAGSAQVSCGLIPRINVFVYDSVGVFGGVRGSLVAEASYESMCADNPTVSQMSSEIKLGLYGNVGVQVGARVQVPGSSTSGTSGQKLGHDIGPFELWNTQFPIYEKVWNLDVGFGYCTPTCRNTKVDGAETDLNCGGGACASCAAGKMCALNTDCAGAYCTNNTCSDNHCGDGALDGDETGIDCGGAKCAKCRTGISCLTAADCVSGYCGVRPGNGSTMGYCVQDHCSDFITDVDETGIDCGGSTCPKCQVGMRSSSDLGCISGYRDDEFCVAGTCRDRVLSAGESGIDCGGSSTCRRCFAGEGCAVKADCASEAPICDPTTKLCSQPMCMDTFKNVDETDVDCGGSCSGCAETKACLQTSDCATGLECEPTGKTCVTPTCTDTWKNGSETDVDCGGSCTTKCAENKTCQNDSDCATAAPVCDSTHVCVKFTCPAGQYAVNNACVSAGTGYWSPDSDVQRYACTNAPANADYTSATASSADCPWSCKTGYLANTSTTPNTCDATAAAQNLRCNADEVAVGINGRSGAWLDALGMQCAKFDGTGITAGTTRAAPSLGGGGGAAFTINCNANEVLYQLTGINGWAVGMGNANYCSTKNLSRVTVVCKDLTTNVTRTAGSTSSNANCTVPAANANFSYQCPNGQFDTGVVVDSTDTTNYVGKMYGVVCR
jgi:hypothetical protein